MASTPLELIRKPAATKIAGISSAQLYLLMRKNLFPRNIKLGRASAWVRSEVEQWARDRIAERDALAATNVKLIQKLADQRTVPSWSNSLNSTEPDSTHAKAQATIKAKKARPSSSQCPTAAVELL